MFKKAIHGLDKILISDIPQGGIIIVTGTAGSLKSAFVYNLLSQYLKENKNENGLYVTLEESKRSHMKNMKSLGIALEKRLKISDLASFRAHIGFEHMDYLDLIQKRTMGSMQTKKDIELLYSEDTIDDPASSNPDLKDIKMKRENIRKNVSAWLKKPHLGMIPLFMAGDKYFFYYTNQLKKHTGIKLNIWGVNNLENTDFKVGFCGIGLDFDKKRIYSLKKKNQFKLIGFYAKNYLTNPAFINSSLIDTIGSFSSRFFFPQEHYYHLFDYIWFNDPFLVICPK